MLELCHADCPFAFRRNIFSMMNLILFYKIKSLVHGLSHVEVSRKASTSRETDSNTVNSQTCRIPYDDLIFRMDENLQFYVI